jgi:uncharacterized protein (TIGR02147 family)
MLPIFDYIEVAKYLTHAFEVKKEINPSFSLRSWALYLGMKSHGPLHSMMKGERAIPKKYVPLLIKSLKLQGKEANFFELLVDLSRAKSIEERELYLERLQKLSPRPLREVNDIEAYKYITEPLHIIIAELTQLKGFKNSLGWIKQKLRPAISLKDIEEILERLIHLGILEKSQGKLIKKVQHIYTAKEVMSKAVQLYHKKMGTLAIEQIPLQTIDEREFNAISFNINPKDLPAIKDFIRQFSNDMVMRFEASESKGEATYHLNIQFFSLTS